MQNENTSNDMEHKNLLDKAEKLAEQRLKGMSKQLAELYDFKQKYTERAYIMLYLAKKILAVMPRGNCYKASISNNCEKITFSLKQEFNYVSCSSEEAEDFVRKMQDSPMEVVDAEGEKITIPVKLTTLTLQKEEKEILHDGMNSVVTHVSYTVTVGDILKKNRESVMNICLFLFQREPSNLGACEDLIVEYHRAGMRTEELMVSLWRANILRTIENDKKVRKISKCIPWILCVFIAGVRILMLVFRDMPLIERMQYMGPFLIAYFGSSFYILLYFYFLLRNRAAK